MTRDRNECRASGTGDAFVLVDTGGIDAADPSHMQSQVADQARQAVAEADLVLLVIDARAGLVAGDEELADILRRSRRPVLVLANKVDDTAATRPGARAARPRPGDPISVSALHGRGTGDLLDAIVERLPPAEPRRGRRGAAEVDDEIRVAILGRPNVGKSSLVNALLGRPRVIVAPTSGHDPRRDRHALRAGRAPFRLIDTAGLRRKRRHRQDIEYWSEVRALEAAQRADIALVLVDASEGPAEGDLPVADEARKAGCATLVVLSKWDITTVEVDDVAERLSGKLRQRPAIVTTSALTGRHVDRMLDAVEELFDRYTSRVGTGALNRAMAEIGAARETPRKGRKRLNVLYATQYRTRPPRFRIVVSDKALVTRDYAYFVENQLRRRLTLEGCPVIIDFKSRE